MKTTPSILLAIFLFAVTTTTTTSAGNSVEIVLDSDGEPVKNGGQYVLSTKGGYFQAGRVRGGATGRLCSYGVTLSASGRPTTLYSTEAGEGEILVNRLLNISFTNLPTDENCTKSPRWVVTRSYPIMEPVMLGSPQEYQDSFLDGNFAIRPIDDRNLKLYKLVFCKTWGECGNIGLVADVDYFMRLAVVVGEPLVFTFNKVRASSDPEMCMVV